MEETNREQVDRGLQSDVLADVHELRISAERYEETRGRGQSRLTQK